MWTGKDIVWYIVDGYKSTQNKKQIEALYKQIKDNQHMSAQIELPQSVEQDALTIMSLTALREINEDIQGWITIEGTPIHDPIVQHSDNDFYLNHNINKEKSPRGALFLDEQFVEADEQIVIYGHHMKDNSMFGSLDFVLDKVIDVSEYPITVQINDDIAQWEIFSAYIYSPEDSFFQLKFIDEQDKQSYIDLIVSKSLQSYSMPPHNDEKILTLVTCYYTEYDARLIIHAKQK